MAICHQSKRNKKVIKMKTQIFLKETLLFGLLIVPILYVLNIYQSLPAQVPLHFGIDGKPDRYGSPLEFFIVIVVISVIGIGVSLLLKYIHLIDPKKKVQRGNDKIMGSVRWVLSIFLSALSFFIIYSVTKNTMEDNNKWLFTIMGLLFVFLGNYLINIKPNYFIGIRTPWTLQNETVWKKTHRLGGKMMFVGGFLVVICSFILPEDIRIISTIAILLSSTFIPVIYSFVVYRKIVKGGLIIIVCLTFSLNINAQLDSAATCKRIADSITVRLIEGRNELVDEDFDSVMLEKASRSRMAIVWENFTSRYGAYISSEPATYQPKGSKKYTQSKIKLEKGVFYQTVYFNSQLKVSGFTYKPLQNESGYAPPAYINTKTFYETKTEVITGNYRMPGLFTVPSKEGVYPVVILLQGSGPNGMNEEIGGCRPFQDLAWGLAAKGFVVLRYDKRTYIYGNDIQTDGMPTIKEEYMDDLNSAIQLVKTKPYINSKQIFVLGHSQGAMLIPMIAKAHKELAGVIAMAGCARPLQDLIPEQLAYLTEGEKLDEQSQLQIELALNQVRLSKSDTLKPNTSGDMLPLGFAGSYWLQLRKYNILKTAKKVKQPYYIIQGKRDYQVTTKEYDLFYNQLKGKRNVSFKLYDKLNHLFVEGEGKSKPKEYMSPGNIPAYIIDDMAAWINLQLHKK
jgi:uncharacterized membrane protein/dienelactone hydrolase